MSKRVEITPEIQATIRRALGDAEVDTSKFAVYEAKSLSTEPLSKGGFFNKARISASTIAEMGTFLNSEAGAIPLHIMHNDRVLPVGRVFNAKTMNMPNGEVELRSQFLIPLDKKEIVADVDNSIIDEVSVGLLTKHAFCSECGFDYYSEDADITNFLNLTCDKGHQIGVDGTHIRLVGLEDWSELSLVGQGAAKNAKILPRAKQSMSKEMVERLAASTTPPEARILTASYKIEDSSKTSKTQGESDMDTKEFVAQLSVTTSELEAKKIELSQATTTIGTLNGEITSLKAAAETATAKIAELEAAKGQSVKELETQLAASKEEMKAATEKLTPHVKAALVASGVAETEVPSDLIGQLKLVEDKGLKLHQVIGAGAKTGAKNDVDALNASVDPRKEAFKLSGK